MSSYWPTFVPNRLGDTTADYARWKAAVARVRDLPEYKLRKLWKANFSPKDIEQNKHWVLFPPQRLNSKLLKVRVAPATKSIRGRRLSQKKKTWIYARVLKEAAEGILNFYSLDDAMRAATQAELDHFTRMFIENAHKRPKDRA